MKSLTLSRTAMAVGVVAALGLDMSIAFAQDTALEEVVVTARRRSESFQDVPISMTTFTSDDIESAGIESPQDFVSLTPNVTLVETQNQGTSFITIRGISQARNSEPSVAVLVDGVLMSNPAQFTQELFDVQQIEVLKGAQGAVYGRNAIGGAMVITTKEPTDEFEGRFRIGYDSGPGAKAQVMGSGPLGDSDKLRYHAALSYYDTDGWLDNTYLNQKADPFKDTSARLRLIYEPSDRLSLDSRIYYSKVDTQAFYFDIDYAGDSNNTSIPITVNNPGIDKRDLSQVSFKLDYDLGGGTTLTSITSFDSIEEIMTGDAFDFKPITQSLFYNLFGADWAQAQYLDVSTKSEELRFTSDPDERLRWIAGAYMIQTDRYISTGNTVDRGTGALAVYRTPASAAPWWYDMANNDQVTFLADSQDNMAWAAFGEIASDLTDTLELSFALRYDKDTRKNTTLTPPLFLPTANAVTGEVRKKTWDELQPRLTLRYEPTDNLTIYGGWSRGFRSGGFNQTGVGTDPEAIALGVTDLFDAEVADTFEVGLKSQFADGRVNMNFSVFDTEAKGSYYFVFLATSSTQNLGSLGRVDYKGYEFDTTTRVTDNFDLFVGYGYTDSTIKESAVPSDIGNQAPLVTKDTTNVGIQYHQPIGGNGLEFFLRGDYQRLGDTWWDPSNSTVRNPVNLLDWRIGVRADNWSVTGWTRNTNDVKYNSEYSPGGFLFKAKPMRWGIDFVRDF